MGRKNHVRYFLLSSGEGKNYRDNKEDFWEKQIFPMEEKSRFSQSVSSMKNSIFFRLKMFDKFIFSKSQHNSDLVRFNQFTQKKRKKT